MACGAATAYRNYFVPMAKGWNGTGYGQTKEEQIDNSKEFMERLGGHVRVVNGYTCASADQLKATNDVARIELSGGGEEAKRESLRRKLRLGVHSDVEVTREGKGKGQLVTQVMSPRDASPLLPFNPIIHQHSAMRGILVRSRLGIPKMVKRRQKMVTFLLFPQIFSSACAVAYSKCPSEEWEEVARLVLEGAYKGVLLSAARTHSDRLRERDEGLGENGGSNIVVLTLLGE